MEIHHLSHHAKNLQSKLSCGADDDYSCAVLGLELESVEELDGGEEEGEGFATAGACSAEDVSASEKYGGGG